jgi:hypothetical protein
MQLTELAQKDDLNESLRTVKPNTKIAKIAVPIPKNLNFFLEDLFDIHSRLADFTLSVNITK